MSLTFDPKPETAALVDLLAAMAPGVLLTFEQLSAAAGVDDIRDQHHLLQSARQIAEREHGVVYRNERMKGYRRLTTAQIPFVETKVADHQRSVARQTIKTLTRGMDRANDVPAAVQQRYNQGLARQGVIARMTARSLFRTDEPDTPPLPVPEIAKRLLDRVRQQPSPRRRSA